VKLIYYYFHFQTSIAAGHAYENVSYSVKEDLPRSAVGLSLRTVCVLAGGITVSGSMGVGG
jgi:hypothetical protein